MAASEMPKRAAAELAVRLLTTSVRVDAVCRTRSGSVTPRIDVDKPCTS